MNQVLQTPFSAVPSLPWGKEAPHQSIPCQHPLHCREFWEKSPVVIFPPCPHPAPDCPLTRGRRWGSFVLLVDEDVILTHSIYVFYLLYYLNGFFFFPFPIYTGSIKLSFSFSTLFLRTSLVAQRQRIHLQCRRCRSWGSIPGSLRSLEEGTATHSDILVWGIPVDRETWKATVHKVAQSQTWLKWLSTLFLKLCVLFLVY